MIAMGACPVYREDREQTLGRIDRHFRVAQQDFQRYLARCVQIDDPTQPALTALEWTAHSSTCSALADTFELAADLWEQIQPETADQRSIASGYRATAHGYHNEASRAEVFAGLAPAGR